MFNKLCLTLTCLTLFTTLIHAQNEEQMTNFSVVEKEHIAIIGISCKTSNAPGAAMVDIPQLWGRFYAENIISQIPNKLSNDVIGLYCDYEGDFTQPYSLVIGCPVSTLDDIPEGMVAKVIPESSYAVFQAVGERPKSIIDTWGIIWKTDLKRTYTGDYELYTQDSTTEIFIAIE